MSMIFDGFKTRADAEKFVAAMKLRFGLDGQVYDTEEASQAADPFPSVLRPPIAHIDRSDSMYLEKQVETAAAREFGGEFQGT